MKINSYYLKIIKLRILLNNSMKKKMTDYFKEQCKINYFFQYFKIIVKTKFSQILAY